MSDKLHAGIDAGTVSLNCVLINETGDIVYEHPFICHFGRVEEKVLELIRDIYDKFGEENIESVSFTGSHGKKLSENFGVYFEFETISLVIGAIHINPGVKTIISLGGQNTALFQIVYQDGDWELDYFKTNGPCASGTGSFIDQQALRLATSMYTGEIEVSQKQIDRIMNDFIKLGLKSRDPSEVACRCTVFTKTDMIHLQNKGEKLEDIIYGLHVGNTRNYMSTIVSGRVLEEPVIFIGGLSLNELQIRAFKNYFPQLSVPRYNTSVGALGVALHALKSGKAKHLKLDDNSQDRGLVELSLPIAPRLNIDKTKFFISNRIEVPPLNKKTRAYLGIDIGSTTTKYALIDEDRKILYKNYVMTRGKPVEVAQELMRSLNIDLGPLIDISGVAATGSGRKVVGAFLNADLDVDEITAHARGAVEIDPDVETIFEIGGQDSKYISISNTHPLDFDMNKVCAAGTGSFLHDLANRYGINIVDEFQRIALSSENPVRLADRCTVFIESDLEAYHQKGISKTDLIAGLCYAIVYNYLNRVVGKRKIGKKLMFLGGPSLNKAVVAAFENVLGRELLVPRHREVLGAYGAAIIAQEKRHNRGTATRFMGLDAVANDKMHYIEKTCRTNTGCTNQCKLKIYDFSGRKRIWGGECGRYESAGDNKGIKENYFEQWQKIWQTHTEGICETLEKKPLMEVDGRPTVGMQRALYGFQTCVLWADFFDRLGFRLVLTRPTDSRISSHGTEIMEGETCYPVKISHGHIRELAGNVKFLFIPSIINMKTPQGSGYYCPMIQSNAYMVRMAMDLDQSRILSPVVHLQHSIETLAVEIAGQIRSKLKVSMPAIRKALRHAVSKNNDFIKEVHAYGRRIMQSLDPGEPVLAVTGRQYNLYDKRLNLSLGRNLARLGMPALPMDFIDTDTVDLSDFKSMFWGLGVQILKTARFIKARPNYYGIHLTNFSCGPDSFLEHFYRHIMGDKPYLILELDEHTAEAGMMTRLEAFKNVIGNLIDNPVGPGPYDIKPEKLEDETTKGGRLSIIK
ncbi:MAG TPA: CoA activase [Spirochaetes bacterium]|nr:CoA activase [Spirochaetota bacterium]